MTPYPDGLDLILRALFIFAACLFFHALKQSIAPRCRHRWVQPYGLVGLDPKPWFLLLRRCYLCGRIK